MGLNYNLLHYTDRSHTSTLTNTESHFACLSPAMGTRPKKKFGVCVCGGGGFPFPGRAEGHAGQELRQGLGSVAFLTLPAKAFPEKRSQWKFKRWEQSLFKAL